VSNVAAPAQAPVRDHVFHRNLLKKYPVAVRAAGVYIFDSEGKAYLDASSGAVAANLGHGVQEIVDAMTAQASQVAFAHTLRFETPVLAETAGRIADLAPDGLETVYFAAGGSEANEAAMKLARQFHLDSGRPGKHLVIGRWQSYHGNTLGALSAGGDVGRRTSFSPMLAPYPHVSAPENESLESVCPHDCGPHEQFDYIGEIEQVIARVGAENISAFICEAIVGSQQGAVVPSPKYLGQVRELCDRHDIVLIVDEVMTGFGRTGKNFAVEHFGVTPDIITFGKGVTGGYAPLSGMIVHDRIVDVIRERSDGVFRHGYTYSGHPVCLAAGNAALTYYQDHKVLDNVVKQGRYLRDRLEDLQSRQARMGPVRGRGLLLGFDLLDVPGKRYITSESFNEMAMQNGAIFYPGKGRIDGVRGQHLLIAPPLTIQRVDIDLMVDVLERTLTDVDVGVSSLIINERNAL
jgi:adenosylmethionine-8-amino-7-oxononanoate aminotransferase